MNTTKQSSPDVGKRLPGALVASFALVALMSLAACGGGGGSSTAAPPPDTGGGTPPPPPPPPPAPPPAPSPSGSLSTAPCDIPAGSASCDTQIVVDAKATVNASPTVDGQPSVSITPGVTPVTVTLTREGDRNVTLRNGDGRVLDTDTVGANCETDSKWDGVTGNICRNITYHKDVVLGRWDLNGRIYRVTANAQMQPLVNKTRWSLGLTGNFLFTAGFKKSGPDEFCRIPVTMFDQAELKARDLYVDPTTWELHERSDAIVDANDYIFGWQTTAEHPDWIAEARTSNAWFYGTVTGAGNPSTYREHLWYWQDGQSPQEVQSWLGTQSGNLSILQTFNCPRP